MNSYFRNLMYPVVVANWYLYQAVTFNTITFLFFCRSTTIQYIFIMMFVSNAANGCSLDVQTSFCTCKKHFIYTILFSHVCLSVKLYVYIFHTYRILCFYRYNVLNINFLNHINSRMMMLTQLFCYCYIVSLIFKYNINYSDPTDI